jgi:hypothetical protein
LETQEGEIQTKKIAVFWLKSYVNTRQSENEMKEIKRGEEEEKNTNKPHYQFGILNESK